MYQLRNVINRRNVSSYAEKDYNACDDFFKAVVECHIVAAAMQYFNMSTFSDSPVHPKLKEDLWLESLEERRDIIYCKVFALKWYYFMEPISWKKHLNLMMTTAIN